MKQSMKTGISFGIASGIITTLGLMVRLFSGTGSLMVVIGGILTIAIADVFSDALGIHLSEESDKKNSQKSVWMSTLSTFLAKFIFALTFLLPLLIFPLKIGIITNIIWGCLSLVLLSYRISKTTKKIYGMQSLNILV